MNKIDYLDNGFPVAAKGEKVTSNNSSIPPMFSTKYLNFKQKMFRACFRTSSKYAFPAAIRFSCFSTADLMVGNTSSMSIYKGISRVSWWLHCTDKLLWSTDMYHLENCNLKDKIDHGLISIDRYQISFSKIHCFKTMGFPENPSV